MTTLRYAAQSFLDGFTSMSSIVLPALRPGSEEPLFLSDLAPQPVNPADAAIMLDVEHFLREVEPLILEDRLVYEESQTLLKKIKMSRNPLSASQSST